MDKTIKLSVEDSKVKMVDAVCSNLKSLFSGCRVNFLLGAGFSANLLGTLGNNEIIFEAIQKYRTANATEEHKLKILTAHLYWSFFKRCIEPIANKVSTSVAAFQEYMDLGAVLYRIFSERCNPALDRQFNIFTTNYDPILELMLDHSSCICNDGFEGRIEPLFSTDNFSKSYYRQAVFSNRKAEIPSLNLFKIHGSVTWEYDSKADVIRYCDFKKLIGDFSMDFSSLFSDSTVEAIANHFTAATLNDAETQLGTMFGLPLLDGFLSDVKQYEEFIDSYKQKFLIVNPTKEKFGDTLLNKNYYELLRVFSNELEKENTLLVVNGFSFRDEHILDLVKRSMVNPSLKILIFAYEESAISEYERLFAGSKNNNISYLCLDGEKLTLKFFDQILSHIHI